MNKQKITILFFSSLLIATLSHLFFFRQWMEGTFMAGPNDGLNQMIPFKQFLYENYTSGNFFYSLDFGFGGGFFGQLGYYFSTNLFFLVTVGVVFLLELLHVIGKPDSLFWAQAIIFSSIIRMTLVILLTTYVFKYMSLRTIPSFIGAALYGASVIYFRHVSYWEFFADAFLFVPLLILGIEKIIRDQKPGWFIFAIAATMFNNFYFAYISFIFAGIYILVRWLISLQKEEAGKLQQLKLYVMSVVLGMGAASISFVPTLYAYFHNYRPAFNQERPLFDFSDNMLLDSRTFLLSTIVVLFLFLFSFYKNKIFRLFAVLTLLFILFHFSPFMGSAFNGFSAPRHRFEYLGFFAAGGLVAAGLQFMNQVKRWEVFVAIFLTGLSYYFFAWRDPYYQIESVFDQYMLYQVGISIAAFLLLSIQNKKTWVAGGVIIVLLNAGMMNVYQHDKLYKAGNLEETTKEYMLSDGYASPEQQQLVDRVQEKDPSSFYRFEWKGMDDRNNIPLIQDFSGTSVYSSILNEHILYWYYEDMEVDMKQESISRYSGFGDRANLYSSLSGKYIMTKKDADRNIPYGFEPYIESSNYQVYRNTKLLPFARTTSNVYSIDSLSDASMIKREQAMLEGIILENPDSETSPVNPLPDLMDDAEVKAVGGTYQDERLQVTEETGGLDLQLNSLPKNAEDIYVSFYIKNNVKSAPWFPLYVNDYRTSRKSRESFYRTGMNNVTIRVPADEKISIRVPKGDYQLAELELHYATYEALEKAYDEANEVSSVAVNGNQVNIQLNNNQKDQFLTIPVPYEKGWHVEVNGESKKVLRANYAYLGVELEEGQNHVSFTYYPPYFKATLVVCLLSVLISFLWIRRTHKW
ncbi:YfhO family protein [Halobacillus sp. B29]|uniref:YfhO family protein n=1 Tax=Halobacillus sp. B29 TaxID=3457432 RepID=UPI003FCD9118